jgi:hypothetical protein
MKLRSKRSLLLLPLVAGLLGLVIYNNGVLAVYGKISSMREMEAEKIRTLDKYDRFIARKSELQARLAASREARRADDTKLIDGQTATVAAANLQNTIKGILTSRGGSLTSTRIEKPEEAGVFTLVSVSIDGMVPDTRALVDALYAIETQTPYLLVTELDARTRDYREPRELIVRLKVTGLTGSK